MDPEGPHPRWLPTAAGVVAAGAACALGALGGGPLEAVAGALAGLAGGAALASALGRRGRQRRQALAGPFPPAWRELLLRRYDHYHRLPAELRARFEDDVRILMAETRVTGIGVEVSEELRLLVAASAATLSLGWPTFEWDRLAEVLLYRQDFGRDYSFEGPELSGQAHAWGTVILSVPSLRSSFADPDDGYHVGLHEFAHLLDMESGEFDGLPAGMGQRGLRAWYELAQREMDRLRGGKSIIDEYGLESPAEFLAVSVEAFFETPLPLRRRHQELYDMLAGYFRQDPAAWEEQRGFG